jgi:hypothetical protein
VELGSTSIIGFPPSRFDSELELPLTQKPSARPRVTAWSDILQCCAKGFYGIHTIFSCPSLSSHYPSCVVAWTGCPESGHLFSVPCLCGLGLPFPCFGCEEFADPNSCLFCLNLCSILTTYL